MADDLSDEENHTGSTIVDGLNTGILAQTRYTRIPKAHLNAETVAGVRDMKLGRIKGGKPVGAPVIRFDTGVNTGTSPHINVDHKGVSSATNPHFNVSSGSIKSVQTISKHLGTITRGLLVVGIAIDAWRLGKTFVRDCDFRANPDQAIIELENAIEECEELLKIAETKKEREEVEEHIELLKNILNEVRLNKRGIPAGTIKAAASIGTSYAAGAAGGWAGATGGAQVGAVVGTVFGPAGTVIGGFCGALIGGISGGISAAIVGSKVTEKITEEIYDSVNK